MKKILIGLVALVFIIGGSAFAWYKINYGGTNYYVQIHNDGKKLEEKTQSGSVWHGYGYKEKAYNNPGQEKTLDFTATHNLRHEAYLKLTYNKQKGVTNWEEVKKTAIPKKALDKL
ncbi:hypothetical protein BUI56_01120 [Lactococcus lactis subsp. lactis]|uniref:YxeA family protein n=1 Tax=Lactococcus lactis TaxID=1358 RepID=UPI000200D069|nr:YxeA family protein [Lactococcus lactis]ADZ64018.1 conserved hypothetical protein [Lactococcus lactis subsp. lactis CV56]KAF0956641.1 hypothetical protein BUI56_01120 [Lactococcus lactis subsp. lactis]QQB11446.1 YxeA family protein [Lactococcus lactis]RQE21888.1 YxeA family protein [Lactococcus lactis]RQE24361.1 YxeA family protein [Lactococcus lactis]